MILTLTADEPFSVAITGNLEIFVSSFNLRDEIASEAVKLSLGVPLSSVAFKSMSERLNEATGLSSALLTQRETPPNVNAIWIGRGSSKLMFWSDCCDDVKDNEDDDDDEDEVLMFDCCC